MTNVTGEESFQQTWGGQIEDPRACTSGVPAVSDVSLGRPAKHHYARCLSLVLREAHDEALAVPMPTTLPLAAWAAALPNTAPH